ncbi:protein of unknown function (plasmid) [Caballeronia sp. S22]
MLAPWRLRPTILASPPTSLGVTPRCLWRQLALISSLPTRSIFQVTLKTVLLPSNRPHTLHVRQRRSLALAAAFLGPNASPASCPPPAGVVVEIGDPPTGRGQLTSPSKPEGTRHRVRASIVVRRRQGEDLVVREGRLRVDHPGSLDIANTPPEGGPCGKAAIWKALLG